MALQFYNILNSISQFISAPILGLRNHTDIAILIPLLIGIVGSTAPCQLTTNLGAVGYISGKGIQKGTTLKNLLWYAAGKLVVYFIYGILAMLIGSQLQQSSIPLFSLIRKFTGPVVVLIGLYLIGMINLRGNLGESMLLRQNAFTDKFKILNPSFALGLVFSLAFCPTLFWLFFGIVIPMSIESSIGIVYPSLFAVGTLIPLVLLVLFLRIGKEAVSKHTKSFQKLQKVIRVASGVLLILFGIVDTIIYWFI